jgi:hypothetical protein
MNRRRFLAASVSVSVAGIIGKEGAFAMPETIQAQDNSSRQILEWRSYAFDSPEKKQIFAAFVASGLIPALNRAGVQPVGAFTWNKSDNPDAKDGDTANHEIYLLLPYTNLEDVAMRDSALAADAAYSKALAELPDGPKEAAAYSRYTSSLFLAFTGCPNVEVPTKAADRVLQLRIYESHNDERSRRKVHMFNEGGEIRIFREAGMNPVFFGHAFAGSLLPNLTYMLGFDSTEAMKTAWSKFRAHPDWIKLQADASYKDTVSRITNRILRPVAGSQI